MDYSSAMPIRCLEAEEGHKILELCSSPGNKSMYLADSVEKIEIKGIEINHNRANIMKSLVKKYDLIDKIQVIVEDGTTYKNK